MATAWLRVTDCVSQVSLLSRKDYVCYRCTLKSVNFYVLVNIGLSYKWTVYKTCLGFI